MKRNKSLSALISSALVLLMLTGCAVDSNIVLQPEQQTTAPTQVYQSQLEEIAAYTPGNSEDIILSGSTAQSSADGCSISGSVVTITKSGTYRLSGKLDGQIVVDAGGENIRLVLDGVYITCTQSAPIYIRKGKLVTITLADGSQNTLTDGVQYEYDDAEKEEPSAAVFSKADLILEGNGNLTVNANFNNGIQSKDTLEIHSGTYIVNAANHGITGKDSLEIGGGSLNINAGGDGLRSNNADSADVGWISIVDGSITINAGQDGMHAESTLHIGGGEIYITAEDDGIHTDSSLEISGGKINISKSCEGIEGERVLISGGHINITASDDGINSAGGSDVESDRPGANMFAVDDSCDVTVNGGTVIVDADGDGIDSNGHLHIAGGTVLVYGPTNNGNGSFDYAGECIISGGNVAVAGSSGMAQGASGNSTQANMLLCFNGTIKGGTLISLTDSQGNVIHSFAPAKDYSSVLVSCPTMSIGQTYKLWLGGSCTGNSDNGVYTDGILNGATEVTEVAVSQISTNYGGGGPGGHGGPGGPGGPGGMGGSGIEPGGR